MKRSYKSGFTIVELLIVIVVIGVLATMVLISFNRVRQRAQNVETIANISQFKKAIEGYVIDNGMVPMDAEAQATPINVYSTCLGEGYDDQTCATGSSGPITENTELCNQLSRYINCVGIPVSTQPPVTVTASGSTVTITGATYYAMTTGNPMGPPGYMMMYQLRGGNEPCGFSDATTATSDDNKATVCMILRTIE